MTHLLPIPFTFTSKYYFDPISKAIYIKELIVEETNRTINLVNPNNQVANNVVLKTNYRKLSSCDQRYSFYNPEKKRYQKFSLKSIECLFNHHTPLTTLKQLAQPVKAINLYRYAKRNHYAIPACKRQLTPTGNYIIGYDAKACQTWQQIKRDYLAKTNAK